MGLSWLCLTAALLGAGDAGAPAQAAEKRYLLKRVTGSLDAQVLRFATGHLEGQLGLAGVLSTSEDSLADVMAVHEANQARRRKKCEQGGPCVADQPLQKDSDGEITGAITQAASGGWDVEVTAIARGSGKVIATTKAHYDKSGQMPDALKRVAQQLAAALKTAPPP